jgi:hypothetical protein
MLLISILCGDKIPNVSGIVLYPLFTYIVSIAPHPHQHRLGLGHCYANLLIFTYQLFRHQLDDLVFPAPVAPLQGVIHQTPSIYLHICHLNTSSGLPLFNSTCGYRSSGIYCSAG